VKVLFDQGTPAPLRHALLDHEVETAFERGWAALANGELLKAAEEAGFAAIITTDKNLRYQQNLAGRRLAIVVLSITDWRRIRHNAELVAEAIANLSAGNYVEIEIPSS
jgi:hypothetical protein